MIRRYKRHYCTSLSDKKNCTMIPATKHWSLHTFTVRSLQWNNQNNLRGSTNFSPPFFESHFVLPQSGISSDLDFVPSLYKWIFLVRRNVYHWFPFSKFSLGRFWRRWKKKKSQDIFMTFLKWISFPTSVPLVLRVFLIVVARIDSSMPHWSLTWVEALFQG